MNALHLARGLSMTLLVHTVSNYISTISFSPWCPMKAPTYASDRYPSLAVAVLKQALE